MPNTPALVGEGMTAVCPNDLISPAEKDQVLSLLAAVGRTEMLDESYFDVFTGLCGSGPAYVYIFIEALADAAVREGLPRDKAYTMAAQTVMGSAKNGSGNGNASRGFERSGLLSRRNYHRGCRRVLRKRDSVPPLWKPYVPVL